MPKDPEVQFFELFDSRFGMHDWLELVSASGGSLADAREDLLTVGGRIYWGKYADEGGVYVLDEKDERSALIEQFEVRDSMLLVSGLLATVHSSKNVRVVAVSAEGSFECAVMPREDKAAELRGGQLFVPVGFEAIIPIATTRFWMDAKGASSPLSLIFGRKAPISNEEKSFTLLAGKFFTSPGKHDKLCVSRTNPVNSAKRIASWYLSQNYSKHRD